MLIKKYVMESNQDYKVFLITKQGAKEFTSLDKAVKAAKELDASILDFYEKASDYEIKKQLKRGDLGLDSGDIELYVITEHDITGSTKVDSFDDLYDRTQPSMVRIRRSFKPFRVYSGFDALEEEAFRRNLISTSPIPAYAYTRRDRRI
jgi:hypothetical protein